MSQATVYEPTAAVLVRGDARDVGAPGTPAFAS